MGIIRVNEYLETNVPGIYAIGDVKGGPAFTHISYDDYRVATANVLEGKRVSIAGRMVPYTVFIDPQLGRIGLTEREARAQGKKIRVAKMAATSIARALESDESRGLLKIVVDAETEQILGRGDADGRGRRDGLDGSNRHDGQAAIYCFAGRDLVSSNMVGGAEQCFLQL